MIKAQNPYFVPFWYVCNTTNSFILEFYKYLCTLNPEINMNERFESSKINSARSWEVLYSIKWNYILTKPIIKYAVNATPPHINAYGNCVLT
jgi:hypothetical protein